MTNEPLYSQRTDKAQYPVDEDVISLMDILCVAARHLKLIIIVPSIFCIVTIIYALFFTPQIYISTATFMSSGSGVDKSQMMGFASQFGFSMPSQSSLTWSYIDVINSRTLARNILNRQFDTKKYGPQKTLFYILTYGDENSDRGIDTRINACIGTVQEMIEVNSSGSMYELKISAFEPQLASDVAIAVLDQLDTHQQEYNARRNTQTRQFIEERLTSTKIELEIAEEALKEFRERNRSIIESPQLQLEQGRFSRDVAVLIGVFTTLKQQFETAKIEEVKESDYVVILDKPQIPIHSTNSKKKLNVILAGILGIGVGLLLAFIREYFRNSNEEERGKLNKAKSHIYKNIVGLLPFKKLWK